MPDTDENFIGFIKQQHNDLTDTACAITPVIQDSLSMLSAQSGCELARVSGSGSSCFGIFDSAENAKVAAAFIQKEKPDWWVRPVTLQ
jgi:4-diphosphocytidyl-2-C-methyl-D-erythritol kinase